MMPAESGASQPERPISVPQVSPDELLAFHTGHFSDEALAHFDQDFLSPITAAAASIDAHVSLTHDDWGYEDQDQDEYEDDDGLGYYEDGVKRTLTDEQIEIFRHSELRELRREQEKLLAQTGETAASREQSADDRSNEARLSPDLRSSNKNNKSKKRRSPPNREPKPDLRKRTWDVVEAGLDSLDYD